MKEAIMIWCNGSGDDIKKFVQWLNSHALVERVDEMVKDEDHDNAAVKATLEWVEPQPARLEV